MCYLRLLKSTKYRLELFQFSLLFISVSDYISFHFICLENTRDLYFEHTLPRNSENKINTH